MESTHIKEVKINMGRPAMSLESRLDYKHALRKSA